MIREFATESQRLGTIVTVWVAIDLLGLEESIARGPNSWKDSGKVVTGEVARTLEILVVRETFDPKMINQRKGMSMIMYLITLFENRLSHNIIIFAQSATKCRSRTLAIP